MTALEKYTERRRLAKIKNYNAILEALREPKTVAQLVTIFRKKASYFGVIIDELFKAKFLEVVGYGHRQSRIYQAKAFDYGAELEQQIREIQAKRLAEQQAIEAHNKKMCLRVVKLEDYHDNYRASQAMRNQQRVKQNVWIASSAAML